jgi:hypothetical protein
MGSTGEGAFSSNPFDTSGGGGGYGSGGGGSYEELPATATVARVQRLNARHSKELQRRVGREKKRAGKYMAQGLLGNPFGFFKSKESRDRWKSKEAELEFWRKQETPYSSGLLEDSPYGPVLSDLARETGYSGRDFRSWQRRQLIRESLIGVETRKRRNKQLGLDEGYGSAESRAEQLAERERIAAERQAGRSGGRIG